MAREKLHLADERIVARLSEDYGLAVTALEFLPLGYDSNAAVYRVQATNGRMYFLKIKRETIDELSAGLPYFLKEQGIDEVVAPLPTFAKTPWSTVDRHIVLLYPFIERKFGPAAGLSDEQWVAFGTILKKLHALRLPPEWLDRLPRETFVPDPKWRALVARLHNATGKANFDTRIGHDFATLWRKQIPEINRVLSRTEALGRSLQNKRLDFVLCHADIHTGNLLIDSEEGLHIVDWDQPILAPRERDLMFVTVGGFVTEPEEERLFFLGYGETSIDPLVLAYYRYERALEDITLFGEQVLLTDASSETKQDSILWFSRQFEPGGLVEAAHEIDDAPDR